MPMAHLSDMKDGDMTDVLKIALDRRAQLHEEVAKLNEFIRYAETLIRGAQGGGDAATPARPSTAESTPKGNGTEAPAAAAAGGDARPSIIRRS